ncbi:hypothetical protein DBV15_08494 [Temnothorax longispinosus]|uniref:Uncharacterized protein n=1 Tax=Temnothorax longispinosus TaxID=300112 RepID=A0A4S2KI88_9HYME|nr:hypothetical protein DBV15_08494 [Temnothorax longispinosus]
MIVEFDDLQLRQSEAPDSGQDTSLTMQTALLSMRFIAIRIHHYTQSNWPKIRGWKLMLLSTLIHRRLVELCVGILTNHHPFPVNYKRGGSATKRIKYFFDFILDHLYRRVTDLAFDRLFLADTLQILFRYSDGLSRVLESALANFGGMNGSTMCLFTRWDAWLVLISSVSAGALAGAGTSGCCGCSPEDDASDLLAAVPRPTSQR